MVSHRRQRIELRVGTWVAPSTEQLFVLHLLQRPRTYNQLRKLGVENPWRNINELIVEGLVEPEPPGLRPEDYIKHEWIRNENGASWVKDLEDEEKERAHRLRGGSQS